MLRRLRRRPKQTCPRRMSDLGPWPREEGQDTWTTGHGLVGQDTVGASCSFCGSLHPDRFMELVREGWIVGPTDKSYKAYLDRPATEEEKRAKKEAWLAGGVAQAVRESSERRGKTPQQVAEDLDTAYLSFHLTPDSAGTEAKFYFQHLSEAQCREFVDLHNSRRIKVGYPGRFYVLPFFMTPAAADQAGERA